MSRFFGLSIFPLTELNNDSLFVFEGNKLKLANKNLRLAFTKEEDGGYVFFNQNGNDWNREFIGG